METYEIVFGQSGLARALGLNPPPLPFELQPQEWDA